MLLPRRQANNTLLLTSRLFLRQSEPRLRASHSRPSPFPTPRVVPARAWAVVGLHQPRSTTNLHGPPNPSKTPQCYTRPPARKRHLTHPAGSPEQVSSPTRHEPPKPPSPNLPNITHLHPQNMSTNPPPHGPTTRRHMFTTLRIPVPVHLGTLNPNRPSQGHQRVHLISSPHPSRQTLPSLCHTPVGYPRSANPRILPLGSHPRARTRIRTGTLIEVVNGIGHLIPTPGRPLGKSAEIPTIRGRSITPQPSVETPRNVQMKTVCYRRPPVIDATIQRTIS